MGNVVNERYELVPVNAVRPHPKNPRRGDLDAIVESIQHNGFYGALIVQRSTGYILAGNHRYLAARKCGFAELPVLFVDVDDKAARRILLADNRTSDLATYDDEQLMALLREASAEQDLAGSGYDAADLDALVAEFDADAVAELANEDEDEDDVDTSLPTEPDSKPGEVYELGPHRLVCGDATSVTDLDKVMRGERADLLWTDPPYNVDYQGKTKKKLTITNDKMSEERFREFLTEAFSAATTAMREGACFYIAHADAQSHNFRLAVIAVGLRLSQNIVWVKDAFVLGRGDYHWRHEPILYGWREGAPHHRVTDRTQDTVWECKRPRRNEEHPTMKPVALVARAIENSTKRGDIVLDTFGGSGTTLIAAARTGRVARIVEIDPRYCDLIRRRWDKHCAAQGNVDVDASPTSAKGSAVAHSASGT